MATSFLYHGNGATAIFLSELGFDVTGVDPSVSGIEVANRSFPHLNLHEGSACDDPTFMDEMNRVVHLGEGNNGPLFELDLDYFIHHSEGVAMTWNDGEPGMGPVFSKKLEALLGPARLDMMRRSGDSLAGRYLNFRLNPVNLAELTGVAAAPPPENSSELVRARLDTPVYKKDELAALLNLIGV